MVELFVWVIFQVMERWIFWFIALLIMHMMEVDYGDTEVICFFLKPEKSSAPDSLGNRDYNEIMDDVVKEWATLDLERVDRNQLPAALYHVPLRVPGGRQKSIYPGNKMKHG